MTSGWANRMLHVGAAAVVVAVSLRGLIDGRALIAELGTGRTSAQLCGSVAIGWLASCSCWSLLGAIAWVGARRAGGGGRLLLLTGQSTHSRRIGFDVLSVAIRTPRPSHWIGIGMGSLTGVAPICGGWRSAHGEGGEREVGAGANGGLPAGLFLVACLLAGSASPVRAAELSNELHPSWSPDGRQIVFESDQEENANLYVVDLESGTVRRLAGSPADDGRPVWSPDGQWIAFHSNREGNYDLYIVRPDGTGLRRLTSGDRDETSPAWDPASTRIVFEDRTDRTTWQLFIVDVESLMIRPLVVQPGSHLTPTWMSSGRIAFSYSPPGGNHDTDIVLWSVDPQGNDPRELLAGAAGNSNVHYSQARDRLTFNSMRDGNWEIYTSKLDGSESRRWTVNDGEGLRGIDGQPEWSPAGDRIAFTSGGSGSLDIVVVEIATSEVRNLTAGWRLEEP